MNKPLLLLLLLLALYPGGIPTSEPPSCDAPRQPTIYIFQLVHVFAVSYPMMFYMLRVKYCKVYSKQNSLPTFLLIFWTLVKQFIGPVGCKSV